MGVPKKKLSRYQILADNLCLLIEKRKYKKVEEKVIKEKYNGVKKLEINYRVRCPRHGRLSNSPYALRDDIKNLFSQPNHIVVREKLLNHLRKENKSLKKRITEMEKKPRNLSKAWPVSMREYARELLKDSEHWPKGFRNKKFVSVIRKYGYWLIDNYMFLGTSKEAKKIGIHFYPPSNESNTIQSIMMFINSVTDAQNRLRNTCSRGAYNFIPTPRWMCNYKKPCLPLLKEWEVFLNKSGGVVFNGNKKEVQKMLKNIERCTKSGRL